MFSEKVGGFLSQPSVPEFIECVNDIRIWGRFQPATDGAEESSTRLFAKRRIFCPFRGKELTWQVMMLTMSPPRDFEKTLRVSCNLAPILCVFLHRDSCIGICVFVLFINPKNLPGFFVHVDALRIIIVEINITIKRPTEKRSVNRHPSRLCPVHVEPPQEYVVRRLTRKLPIYSS